MHALMTTTKISSSGNRYRATLPRGVANAIGMADRENRHVAYRVACLPEGIALELSLSSGLESGPNVLAAQVLDSGQVRLELPRFQIAAWGLADHQLAWPAPEEVAAAPDEPVTLRATVPEWEPPETADLFAASAGFSHRSAITKSGDTRENVETHIPITLAERHGLTDEGVRARVTFDCVDGRAVMVVTPTEGSRTEVPNSLAVHLAGANDRQARINAGRIAAEFEVLEALDDGSVPLRWMEQNGALLAFVAEE